jgi:hypothetical protein
MPLFLRRRPCAKRSSSTKKALKARLARPDKFQESDPLKVARFTDAQQYQIFAYTRLRARSANDVPQEGKLLDRVLSVVVVPGNAVIVQRRKERTSVLLEALTPSPANIGFPALRRNPTTYPERPAFTEKGPWLA